MLVLFADSQLLAGTGVVQVKDNGHAYAIEAQTEVLQSGATPETIGRYWGAFKPLKVQELTLSSRLDLVYWFRFTVRNETGQHLYAMLKYLGFSRAELYEWDGKEARRLGVGGMDVPAGELFVRRTSAILPLNLLPGHQKTYLLRTQRLWIKSGPVVLYPEYALLSSVQRLDLQPGLLLGCLLTAFMYVLASSWLSREVSYSWLAAQMLVQLVQSLLSGGLIPGYLDLPDWVNVSQVYYASLALTGIMSRQFQCHFLPLATYGNRFLRLGYRVHLSVFVAFLGAAFADLPRAFDYLELVAFILYLFLLYSNWVVYRNGYKPALYLFLTQLIPLLFAPVAFLQQTGEFADGLDGTLIPYTILTFTGYALTIGYKVRLYKEEAEHLLEQQNEQLEDLVAERTHDLLLEKSRADQQSERLRLALRELNHRVRNNLAVVSSLLKVQSNNVDAQQAQEAFQESRQRVEAMALIHQQLYQSEEVTTIDVPVFIANLTRVLSEAYGYTSDSLQLNLRLDAIELLVEKAIPLGLLLNEVLTNAFKYGLSKVNRPELSITLQNNDLLYLNIQDNGPGMEPAVWQGRTASFGRRLVEGLTRQLNGHYQLSCEGGARFQFWLLIAEDLPLLV